MSHKDAAMPAAKRTMAEQADIHELYELSVQNVEHEVEFLQKTFQDLRANGSSRAATTRRSASISSRPFSNGAGKAALTVSRRRTRRESA